MTNSVRSILDSMKAETLLEGSSLLTRLAEFPSKLMATHSGKPLSFDEYYELLSKEVEDLPRLKLLTEIPNEAGDRYIAELINNLDELQDKTAHTTRKIVNFLARLTDAESDVEMLSAEFEGWYILAGNDYLSATGAKLPASNLKAIAKSEFSRLMGYADNGLTSLIEAVKVLLSQVKLKQKTAQDKFALGQQQANASWANNLPTLGHDMSRPRPLIPDQEIVEEDVSDDFIPPYVSKLTKTTPTPPAESSPQNENDTSQNENDIFELEDDSSFTTVVYEVTGNDTATLTVINETSEPEPAEDKSEDELTPADATASKPIVKHGDPQPVRVVSAEEAVKIMQAGEEEREEPAPKPFVMEDDLDELDITPVKKATPTPALLQDAPIPAPVKKRTPMKFDYSDED